MDTMTRRTGRQHHLLIALCLLALTLIAFARPVDAQSAQRCFPETGYCISGAIRAYWERNGGLAVFGYPISDVTTQTIDGWTGPVQWFERDRLEDHQNEGKGILTGRLGARFLDLTGRPWQRGEPLPLMGPCRTFEQTGYAVCGMMLEYWRANGGLERFGYPISYLQTEMIEGKEVQVQYFERRRMEYHPEHAGTPFVLQLGLLGSEIYRVQGPTG